MKGTDILHKEYGPAIEYSTGEKQWWVKRNLHRENGPAVEHPNGDVEWYINGLRIKK